MKKIIFLLSLLLIYTNLFSQTSEELFKKGNDAYQHNDYKTAIACYNQLITGGYESGDLLYNLGNSYFRTGQFAPAILNYERARKYIPGDDELIHNIAIANLRIKDRLEKVPKLFVLEWWEQVKNMMRLSFYQYFILFLFIMLMSSIALFFWFKDYFIKKRIFLVIVTVSVIFVFFTTAFVTKALENDNQKYAVLFQQALKVKSSPDDNAADLFEIHYGLKFQIIDELDSWNRILLIDGKSGWIKKTGFEVI